MSVNCCVVVGSLSSAPEVRVLASGEELATVQVTTRPDEGNAISVPVCVAPVPEWLLDLDAGDAVAAIGVVRRRFFRAGGVTASRVEVAAHEIVRADDRRAMRRIQRRANAITEDLLTPTR